MRHHRRLEVGEVALRTLHRGAEVIRQRPIAECLLSRDEECPFFAPVALGPRKLAGVEQPHQHRHAEPARQRLDELCRSQRRRDRAGRAATPGRTARRPRARDPTGRASRSAVEAGRTGHAGSQRCPTAQFIAQVDRAFAKFTRLLAEILTLPPDPPGSAEARVMSQRFVPLSAAILSPSCTMWACSPSTPAAPTPVASAPVQATPVPPSPTPTPTPGPTPLTCADTFATSTVTNGRAPPRHTARTGQHRLNGSAAHGGQHYQAPWDDFTPVTDGMVRIGGVARLLLQRGLHRETRFRNR